MKNELRSQNTLYLCYFHFVNYFIILDQSNSLHLHHSIHSKCGLLIITRHGIDTSDIPHNDFHCRQGEPLALLVNLLTEENLSSRVD